MTKSYQWYYNNSAISGATGKTHTLTAGQTNSDLIECRSTVTYGSDGVAALAPWVQTQEIGTQLLLDGSSQDAGQNFADTGGAPWNLINGITSTLNTWNSPLGGTKGDTLNSDGLTTGETRGLFTFSASTVYNWSCYFAKTGHQWIRFRCEAVNVWFDVVNGTQGTTDAGASNVAITDEGNAFRCSFEITATGGASSVRIYMVPSDGSTSSSANSSVQVDGALLTEGTGLKAYPV